MAVAYVQEFKIVDGDTSTTNYDAVNDALGLTAPPDGLIAHTAGFDHDRGVFRIFDVWESREAGQRFIDGQVMPIIERMAADRPVEEFAPPTAEYWYDLHDTIS
jgi:hypothetical protein